MRRLILIAVTLFVGSCEAGPSLDLAPGWQVETVAEWRDAMPDMIVLSADGRSLFITNETGSNMLAPSLSRLDLASGEIKTLLYGLDRADGLKLDSNGNLWFGEEVPDGLVFRIDSPGTMKGEQRFDRDRLIGSSDAVKTIPQAGRFAHEGVAFSKDGRQLYLADEWREGCLFRLTLATMQLAVFHADKGWLEISTPNEARLKAEILHGRYFNRIEDMELLPDGRILMAETGTGDILVLDDQSARPSVSRYFRHPEIHHPDNLEWDSHRKGLWITDDSNPSFLWFVTGNKATKIASHSHAEITGVESGADGSVWFNLQHNSFGPDMTVKLVAAPDRSGEP